MTSMAKARLLISFAHPDDESFGLGAAIPKWINDGVDVYLICATNGDVGTIPDRMKGKYDTVAELRLSELDCAMQILKFKAVFKLGYKDSGMMGSKTSKHPASLWYQWERYPNRVTAAVAKVLRQIRPQVVITFNPYGGYGHPDHIAIHRATVRAFECAGDARLQPEEPDGLKPYCPQKLYYSAFPKLTLQLRILSARLKGQDPRRMGVNRDVDMVKILDHVEPIHARIPIGDYFDIWEQASRCHASQGGGRITRTAKWLRKILYSKQGFTRVYPPPSHNRVDEDDLFAGVMLD